MRPTALVALALAAVLVVPASAKRSRRQASERGAELRAVHEAAGTFETLFVPVSGPVVLTAETATYDAENGSIFAEGDVTVSFGEWALECATVRFDLRAEIAEGAGGCTLSGAQMQVRFDRAELLLATLEGVLMDMEIRGLEGRYRFEAGRMRRMATGTIYVDDGWMTPCGCEDRKPAWSIRARFIRIETDGTVHHKRGWFCLGRKRIVPVPPGRFDSVTGRASGLLMPDIRLGGSQPFSIGLPVYFTTSRNTDLTLTPAWYDSRGFLMGSEFRYAIGPSQGGQLSFSALEDAALLEQVREALGQKVQTVGEAGYSEVRFWAQWRHYQRAPNALFGAQVDILRDDMILRDFEQDYGIRRTPYLVSNIWGGIHDERAALRAEVELVDDVTDVSNGDALHSLPHLHGSGTRIALLRRQDFRVALDLDGDVAWHAAFPNVWKGKLKYPQAYVDAGTDGYSRGTPGWPGRDSDHTEDDGHYNAGEPVRRTVRGALSARVSANWTPGGWLWLRPWAEARTTLYGGFRVHAEPTTLATVLAGAQLGTALYRDFGGGTAEGGTRHVIEPRVSFEVQPFVKESVHPVLTYDDLQRPHQRIEVELVNRIQRARKAEFLQTQPRLQALEVRLSTALELNTEARFDPDMPLEPARLELAYHHAFARIGARTVVAWEEQPIQAAGVGGSLNHPNGNQVSLNYDWVRGGADVLWSAGIWAPLLHAGVSDQPIHEATLGVTWVPYSFMTAFLEDKRRIVRGFALGAKWRVDLRGDMQSKRSRLLNHEYSLLYTSPCACWRGGLDLRFASDWGSPSFGFHLDLLTR